MYSTTRTPRRSATLMHALMHCMRHDKHTNAGVERGTTGNHPIARMGSGLTGHTWEKREVAAQMMQGLY